MKIRVFALGLAVTVLLVFTACGQQVDNGLVDDVVSVTSVEETESLVETSQVESVVSAESAVSTESVASVSSKAVVESKPAASKAQSSKLVDDALYETLKDPFDGTRYTYRIPCVNLSGATQVNQKMLADGKAWLNDAKKCQKQGTSIINGNYAYSWNNHKGVISILVAGRYAAGDNLKCYVYNVSASNGEQLSNDDLLNKFQLSQQEVTDLIVKKAGERYKKEYAGVNSNDDFYKEQYNNTVATSNAKQSSLFINKSGDLCSVTKIYSLAGASSYLRVLNLTGTASTDFPR